MSIILPVYNEGATFERQWEELVDSVKTDFTAYVVYDFDEDNTLPVIGKIVSRGERRLRNVKNRLGRGVVAAVMTGFEIAPDGPVLVAMADLSDDLSRVGQMLALYEQGYHVVVGSRYMKGGRQIGGPFLKQILSRLAGASLCLFRGLPTHDATNAFKIYDRAMVRSFCVESRGGFELNLELTVKAFLTGHRIAEVPSTWRDRIGGQSRFRLWKWLPLYLYWYFYAFRRRAVHAAALIEM
ncbi:MAG TPA: glycosyltransferase family 2 protein [Candidatus Saccharimonadales bacterium]|nr:glycosyltransferase family 2 protein [Candidatus Saccharimonadales bacterium]